MSAFPPLPPFLFNYSVRFKESSSEERCSDEGRPELTDKPNLFLLLTLSSLYLAYLSPFSHKLTLSLTSKQITMYHYAQGAREALWPLPAGCGCRVNSFTLCGILLLADFKSSASIQDVVNKASFSVKVRRF